MIFLFALILCYLFFIKNFLVSLLTITFITRGVLEDFFLLFFMDFLCFFMDFVPIYHLKLIIIIDRWEGLGHRGLSYLCSYSGYLYSTSFLDLIILSEENFFQNLINLPSNWYHRKYFFL